MKYLLVMIVMNMAFAARGMTLQNKPPEASQLSGDPGVTDRNLLPQKTFYRSSSANPFGMVNEIEMTNSLTDVIMYFTYKMVSSSILEKLTTELENLENEIKKLPINIEIEKIPQETLESHCNAEANLAVTRHVLEGFSGKLKSGCEQLISMYNRNDVSSEAFRNDVKQFVILSETVEDNLKDALNTSKNTPDVLYKTKAMLRSYHFKLEIKKINHTEVNKSKIEYKNQEYYWVGGFTLGIGFPIITSQIADIEDTIREVEMKIGNVQAIVLKLVSQNDEMIDYLLKEINLIFSWKMELHRPLKDHQRGITPEDIEFGLSYIKDGLEELKEACIKYLNHKLPERLQTAITSLDFS